MLMETWEALAYRRLAVSICKEACDEYMFYTKKLKETKDAEKKARLELKIKECLDFFYSDRFRLFSRYDGPIPAFLEGLDTLVKNGQTISINWKDKGQDEYDDGEDFL